MIERLLYKYLDISKHDVQYRQISLVLISVLSCTAVAAFFTFYNLVIDYYPPLLYVDAVGTLVGLFSLYVLLHFGRIQLASFTLLLMVTGVCFMVILDRNNLDYSMAWALIAPVLSVFLLGDLYGTLYSTAYLAAVLWFAWSNLGVWEPAPWDLDSFSNMVAIYLLLFMLSCYYEASRRAAQKLLQDSNEKLLSLATTDPLTGLYNRRYLEDELLNSKQNVMLAMADVDDFKKINDNFGHAVGDDVLVNIARIMQEIVGAGGIVGRWGGEEFIIIWQLQDQAEFESKLTQLLTSIENHPFGCGRPVTISLGGVCHQAQEHRAALRAVDEALYSAKMSGKNCFKLVDSL